MMVLRADGGAAIGSGHVMRCLALAHAWHDAGGAVALVSAGLSGELRYRLTQEYMTLIDLDQVPGSVLDAEATAQHALRAGAQWLVADGYGFGAEYQRVIKQAGLKLLVLDDYGHAEHYYADIVLNQNLDADRSLYNACEPATRLLLGTTYALLRREFVRQANRPRSIPQIARNVLVNFGGSDPHDLAARTIRAIRTIEEPVLETTVVAGDDQLQERLAPLAGDGPQRIEVLGHVSEMPELMASADLAIAAAGGSSWERALLRLPSLVVIAAENQRSIARALNRVGAAAELGWWSDLRDDGLADSIRETALNEPLRRRQSEAAGRLVDGLGAGRVVVEMTCDDAKK
jgi:UDP-2,4-diacetamido-2,4,6-trideoxy-beta-L-altropyranose hydrolase